MFRRHARLWLLLTLPFGAACGSSSGPVLERIKEIEPPDSNLRADVFIVQDVQSCAIGDACRSNDPDLCFTLSDASGPRLAFSPDTVKFVPPDSPAIASAAQSGCFRLTIDDATQAAVRAEFEKVRQQAFQFSAGEVNLSIKYHPLGPIVAGFKRWENRTGIFLQPDTLDEDGLPLITRETDFVYAVTGIADASSSLIPKVEECAGTNWLEQGGYGGTSYTWVSQQCASSTVLLWHFLAQTYFALRDVTEYPDVYRGNYPQCGRNSADPSQWFPKPTDCGSDPDAPTCGMSCSASQSDGSFVRHIFEAHWPKGLNLIGNHCRDGRTDFGELGVDTGGVCDLIGR